ncbi:MAG: helicase-related protein [Gemmatimonadales bacterium]
MTVLAPALAAVLAAIADAVLGDATDPDVTVGAITLRDHQRDALRRLRAGIDSTGGALLADDPGLGKTYVALALAQEFPAAIVVAPAALRGMWRSAAAQTGVDISFVSVEALSRRGARTDAYAADRGALVIVDEAHHAANPATARYARLARLVAYRRVLLISATPVRTRRAELAALLALFMGPRAYSLDDAERARCIVRRTGDASLRPAVDGPHWHPVRARAGVAAAIATMPPPLPALDGRESRALLRISLARCWASSLAALDTALRRRLQRGAALGALLDAGRIPTRGELRAWVVGDDAVQLAFPMLASHEVPDAARLRVVLDAHVAAVHALRARVQRDVRRDAARRAGVLTDLRRVHPGARIVAFTAHAATAEALFRALRREPGVALLTARGARTAGGARPRADVIDALGAGTPRPEDGCDAGRRHPRRDAISLVITTDLLSEGVNLQGASVVVHLDTPWTPAGLDQRVGRAARMGSPHDRVHVHGISPPRAATRLLALDQRLARKRAEQAEAARAPDDAEKLRAAVRGWRDLPRNDRLQEGPLLATTRGTRNAFIAVVGVGRDATVVCAIRHDEHRWKISDAPSAIGAIAAGIGLCSAAPDASLAREARAALDRWLCRRSARGRSGARGGASRARRALHARLDAALREAHAHSRPALAPRSAAIRVLVDRAISAGAEGTLAELCRLKTGGLEALLAACEERLDHLPPRTGDGARWSPVVRALLVLRRDA